MLLQALEVLQSSLQTLQSHPAGLLINGLALALLAVTALQAVAAVIGFVYAYFLRPGRNLKFYGPWAVVTGSTDGIGKAYCEELAKKGLNLVLISRTESKLKEVAAELSGKFGVEARYVAADLCKAGPDTFAKIGAALEGLEVGLLVNNAGMSYDHSEYLDEMDAGVVPDMVTINALVPTMLCHMVVKGMRERGRGAIVNVGSGVSTVMPQAPLLAVYGATKAYVDSLSRSLDAEYSPMGVRVQNQAPMYVATKMSKIKRARLDAPMPATWAAAAVKQIGRETSFTPYWFHGLQSLFVKLAPTSLINTMVMNMQQDLRARYHRRLARQQAEAAAAALGDEPPPSESKRELRRRK
ncbi:hypothetical protein CHLNCDRAFT_56728 [Chlorella variabilis]|uniref:Very-long-chain 3-oxoacyl-CoA reductase n=1 Tax=Chlorella variabilis TaxID=554065 RepID=E1Z4Q6_CHLVA|nr:hypothetical protein CHLNCDRAFT_56728 [Chlorella variabilis]EFN59097.1 hypothetical protein CHLNCDRAFT_56728 [Chlorella variabilis]|eukprot:XP_005851199.1 hypothetical protein CHLNCDRAFT_56728 [Chlorella variabilis]